MPRRCIARETRLQRLRSDGLALAVRRRRRHAGRARRQGIAGRRKAGARTQAAAAGRAMAHPPRPHRGSRLRVRHRRRHLRQDRPRRVADDADRRRRSLRALGRRPRRLVHHAAQAQSRGGRDRARRRDHGAQSRGDDFCRPGRRSRAQRRALARGMADLADADAGHLGRACRHRRYRRRAGSRRRAHAPQSRRHQRPDHGGSGDDGAWRKKSARATRII